MCHNLNLAIPGLGDAYGVAQVANAIFDLDLIVKKFFEGRDIEDLVANRLGTVDSVLQESQSTGETCGRDALDSETQKQKPK